ncbi:MAG: hypothetical protein LBU43_06370 [Candidatus Accumulibacter sp.]|nr:hypothetical protein [Accumulibacter sp.]
MIVIDLFRGIFTINWREGEAGVGLWLALNYFEGRCFVAGGVSAVPVGSPCSLFWEGLLLYRVESKFQETFMKMKTTARHLSSGLSGRAGRLASSMKATGTVFAHSLTHSLTADALCFQQRA